MSTKTVWSEDLKKEYAIGTIIGKGQYGNVSVATRSYDKDKTKCVIKTVARTDNYLRELDHLITVKSCYQVLPIARATLTKEQLCMEFERAECSLFDHARASMKNMSALDVVIESLSFTAHILSALTQIHQAGIAHRDLKTGNIVVMKNPETGEMEPWIIDFGMSKRIGTGGKDISMYEIVTCSYRAPELWEPIKKKKPTGPGIAPGPVHPNKGRIYDHKVDVWSAGCILYEMLTSVGAFGGRTEDGIRERMGYHMRHVSGLCSEYEESFPTMGVFGVTVDLDTEVRASLTARERAFKGPRSVHLEKNDIDLNAAIHTALMAMNAMLQPKPDVRCTAVQALGIISTTSVERMCLDAGTRELIVGDWSHLPEPDKESKRKILQLVETFCHIAEHYKLSPAMVYLAIDLWLRAICVSSRMVKLYPISVMLMASIQVACSYTAESTAYLKFIRDWLKQARTYEYTVPDGTFSPAQRRKRGEKTGESLDPHAVRMEKYFEECENVCASNIVTLLSGRIWSNTAGDIRHLRIPYCLKDVWHSVVDRCIFANLISSLAKTCLPKNPETIVSDSLIGIKAEMNVRKGVTTMELV